MPARESACRLRACGPQWPTVEQPSQDEKEVLLGQYSNLSPSPAHLLHTTNITLSRIKCERLYFYKEVYSFVHWSSSLLLTMFPDVYVYVYVAIQQEYLDVWKSDPSFQSLGGRTLNYLLYCCLPSLSNSLHNIYLQNCFGPVNKLLWVAVSFNYYSF